MLQLSNAQPLVTLSVQPVPATLEQEIETAAQPFLVLSRRRNTLEAKATLLRSEMEQTKAISLALTLSSSFLGNPIVLFATAIGLVGYIGTIIQDLRITHKFCPVPFCRMGITDIAGIVGAATNTQGYEITQDPLEHITSFLNPVERVEYRVLYYFQEVVNKMLMICPQTVRYEAYCLILAYAERTNTLPTQEIWELALFYGFDVSLEELLAQQPQPQPLQNQDQPQPLQNQDQPRQVEPRQIAASAQPEFVTVDVAPVVEPPVTRINPPVFLQKDPKERMMALLQEMAAAGFPLGTLLHTPFVWSWGNSQSGKTSIVIMLIIARMVMLDAEAAYYTTDDDYPRNLRWKATGDSPEAYREAIATVTEKIRTTPKGGLVGQNFAFDETFNAYANHQIGVATLLENTLMRGPKTGAGVLAISQNDTSSAHGLEGIDTAWRNERTSINAIHQEDNYGKRSPTGRYSVTRGGRTELWTIPPWMLTEKNEYGEPDPVLWMINRFPEVVAQAKPEQAIEKLVAYLSKRDPMNFNTLEKNWARNHGVNREQLRELIQTLLQQQRVRISGETVVFIG